MTDSTLQFLNFYTGNLSTLSKEIQQNKRSIELVIDNIKAQTSDVQQKFNQLVVDMMKKQTLSKAEEVARDSQIKRIYFQIRQIQKLEGDKRTLTRESCNILDKYFATLGRGVESIQSNPVNTDDDGDVLAKTLASIKVHLNKPVVGDAVVVDAIKKVENRTKNGQHDHEANKTAVDGDNRNIDVVSTVSKSEKTKLEDMLLQKTKDIASNLHRVDNLQAFIDKVVGICAEMKDRYGTGETSDAQLDESTNNDTADNEETTDDDEHTLSELCHCRTLQFGQMVECDNPNCKIKWYHFACVGLSNSPKGMWFCPRCVIFGDETK